MNRGAKKRLPLKWGIYLTVVLAPLAPYRLERDRSRLAKGTTNELTPAMLSSDRDRQHQRLDRITE
jgi:hypothetical protein